MLLNDVFATMVVVQKVKNLPTIFVFLDYLKKNNRLRDVKTI